MKIKAILMSMLLVLGMTLVTYAEPVSMGQGNSKSTDQIINDIADTLTVKKFSGTIKWSKDKWSKTTIIATANTSVEDLSFIDEEGLTLNTVFKYVASGGYWNAVNLAKVNKSKTVAKFLYKNKEWKESHIVIMKLKKGVLTLIIKNKGASFVDEQLGLANVDTDGWEHKTLGVMLNISNEGTTISDSGFVSFIYQTKQDKVTKIKGVKGVK